MTEKWIAGTLPKRGAAQRPRLPSHGSALVKRVMRQHSRQMAGQPLASVLDGRLARTNLPYPGVPIAATVTIALGLVGALIGLALGRLILLLPGLLLLGGGCFLLWRGKRQNRRGVDCEAGIREDAARFDAYLDRVLPELPAEAGTALRQIKVQLAAVLVHLGDRERAGAIPIEEQLFVRELIVRYAPDVCDSYLAVVRLNREVPRLAADPAPAESLLAQIAMLSGRLTSILGMMAAGELEKQALQEAFIATKR